MPGGRGWFMPMGGPLIPEGVMPAAMLAGFMLPPMEAGPRGPGWFMNWLLYAWVGPIWKEEQTFNGRRKKKKKNKMPHALKVQGGKGGEVGGSGWWWGALSCVDALVPRPPGAARFQGSVLPSAGRTGKMQPKKC